MDKVMRITQLLVKIKLPLQLHVRKLKENESSSPWGNNEILVNVHLYISVHTHGALRPASLQEPQEPHAPKLSTSVLKILLWYKRSLVFCSLSLANSWKSRGHICALPAPESSWLRKGKGGWLGFERGRIHTSLFQNPFSKVSRDNRWTLVTPPSL